ncbi:MAG: TadE family type IV pilus minor pilin [Beutenbergiaceae bacterium]
MTAELALGLPAVVLVLLAVLTVAVAAITQMRCTDAARAAARAAAVGSDQASVELIVASMAGDEAQVVIAESSGWIRVVVTSPVPTPWTQTFLSASAEFVAPAEPGPARPGAP